MPCVILTVSVKMKRSNEPAWIGLCAPDCSEVASKSPIIIVLVFLGLPGEVLSIINISGHLFETMECIACSNIALKYLNILCSEI